MKILDKGITHIMETLESLRGFKIFDYAIFDLVISLGGIYLISGRLSKALLKLRISIPKKNWLFLTLPIGIVFHVVSGNITPMTRDLFDLNGFYILKILMIFLIVIGLKDIKVIKKNEINNHKKNLK